MNVTFCLGWLRREENQYLSNPSHRAKDLVPELQDLPGYSQGNHAPGYYADPESLEPLRDLLRPEMALGRKPLDGAGRDAADLLESKV